MAENVESLLAKLLERLPAPPDPYEKLREELRGQSERIIRVEEQMRSWRWVMPLFIALITAIFQLALLVFR